MVWRISSMITTMIDPHLCPQVCDDIDLLQGIRESFKPNWTILMIFHQKFNSLFSIKDLR